MGLLFMALGLALCLEGLAMALAPSRIEEVLEMLRRLPLEARRLIGLLSVVAGIALLALAGPAVF